MKNNLKKVITLVLVILMLIFIFVLINRKLDNRVNDNGKSSVTHDKILPDDIEKVDTDDIPLEEQEETDDISNESSSDNNKVSIDNSSNKIEERTTEKITTTTTKKINNNESTINDDNKSKEEADNSITAQNDKLRQEINSKYGVNIIYKDETDDVVKNSNIKFTKEYDEAKINNFLNKINTVLSKYPSGFFKEIKNKWKTVSICLVSKFSGQYSGITDNNNFNTVVILLAYSSNLLEATAHHEIMHFIDCYLREYFNVDTINSFNDFNPSGFVYGDNSSEYVYLLDNNNTSYFVSIYSKSKYSEDRAEVFADMMFRWATRPYYTKGNPINEKARIINEQLEKYFDSVVDSRKAHWGRFVQR